MDKSTRNAIERATQQARKLLDDDFSSQLEGTFDVLRSGVIAPSGGVHLSSRQQFQRGKLVAAIDHKLAAGMTALEAVADYVRDAAFTTLNRFIALKMLEARELVQECITKGEQSSGYREFCGMAPGLALIPDAAGYRLYVESLFDEFSTEIKVLFDRRDAASVLWPRRQTFEGLLTVLNAPELAGVWGEDETIGWVYQFFNSGEERKKMRDESHAPRNSRELAVRNQFFTPRYVVQFLVDNTLGRMWLEMHGNQSGLTKLCEYLVRSADEPPRARPRKDPRDLRILDPACGSGHFLLYSFDLLLAIYEEAWSAEIDVPRSESTGHSLREDYPDLADLCRAAPTLIVELNLNGVDIDPRCAQIAALALWLRAQRTWKDLGIAATDRPRIQRTHIVVAEPMPGDAALVEEFAAHLDPPLLRDLFKKMVAESRLAGELGTLLRIEDGIAAELHQAREQFVRRREHSGFLPGMEPAVKLGSLDLSGIDDDQFFHGAETRIVDALRAFSETATGSANARRRLFAGDAAQGIAFIDLLRRHYDVVLMNPPFGESSPAIKTYLNKNYKGYAVELYCAFVDRCLGLLVTDGYIGCITSSSFVLYADFSEYRRLLLERQCLEQLADLGNSVLDGAYVSTAAYVIKKASPPPLICFYDLRFEKNKTGALVQLVEQSNNSLSYVYPPSRFLLLPGFPLCHWASDSLFTLATDSPALDSILEDAGVGAAPQADFFSLWWEVPAASSGWSKKWVRIANGGAFSPFLRTDYLVVDWQDDGERAIADLNNRYPYLNGNVGLRIQRTGLFGKNGITYGKRTDRFNAQVLPNGQMFSFEGIGVFPKNTDEVYLLGILAYLNTRVVAYILNLTAGLHKNDVYVRRLPFPLDERQVKDLGTIAAGILPLVASALSVEEHNELFCGAHFSDPDAHSLSDCVKRFKHRDRIAEADLFAHISAIETRVAEYCGLDDRLLSDIERDQGPDVHRLPSVARDNGGALASEEFERARPGFSRADFEKSSDLFRFCLAKHCPPSEAVIELAKEGFVEQETLLWFTAGLISFATGAAFGRWDIRFATGEKKPPHTFNPFSPAPAGTTGLLQNERGLPLTKEDVKSLEEAGNWNYPIQIPWDGILVDDPGHPLDLDARVNESMQMIWNDRWALIEREVCEILGVDSLRDYLRKPAGMFADHLKRYSKSRRQAPIYWPLSTASGGYTIWLYYHRFSQDTLYHAGTLANNKLAQEERRLVDLARERGTNLTASQRKELAAQETFVSELRALKEEIANIAPLWRPNLNDGVIFNSGPLWRMIIYRPWQKSVKEEWDKLCKGDYDWTQLAMHLWPERVLPKCITDRGLAVAHGLVDTFWTQGSNRKWKARSPLVESVNDLVRERTSGAVKASLERLTASSAPNSAAKRKRRSSS
jgi:hypothetical protein